MVLEEFWWWVEATPLATHIAESWWFPLLESIHVLGITMVVGAILMVDLRMLGVAARSYAVSRMSKELIPWVWSAFVVAVVTGVGLFITRASHYVESPAFQAKMVLILLAGINMAVFHFVLRRDQQRWDDAVVTPTAAKVAGASSLFFWCGVMLAGRWIGHLL